MENLTKQIVNVVATSYVRATGEKEITRMESIDLTKGMWAKYDTWNETQVKSYYESYWNDLNPNSRAVVYVDVIC